MKFTTAIGLISNVATVCSFSVNPSNLVQSRKSLLISAVPPRGGLSFEEKSTSGDSNEDATYETTTPMKSGVVKGLQGPANPFQDRGKLNEIDFCMSPADVSLSRLYQTSSNARSASNSYNDSEVSDASIGNISADADAPKIMSLTRALNNASNRAVRRILLSRSWPSPEALNISLRQVLAAGSRKQSSENPVSELSAIKTKTTDVDVNVGAEGKDESEEVNQLEGSGETTSAKCPVPRPILNIIMKEQDSNKSLVSNAVTDGQAPEVTSPAPLARKGSSDEKWVEDQLVAFKDTYGDVEGYEFAEAYMECILNLATSGIESPRVSEVMDQGVYEDSYRRIISVLKSVGVNFEGVEDTSTPRMRIASKLNDQDICLSMLDKINIQNGGSTTIEVISPSVTKEKMAPEPSAEVVDEVTEEVVEDVVVQGEGNSKKQEADQKEEKKEKNQFASKLLFWMTPKEDENPSKTTIESKAEDTDAVEKDLVEEVKDVEEKIKPEDLGGVLLSKGEPTITRQLNILSNIVKRTLLFGGDQEILVLSKTLEADRPAFINQWYPGDLVPMSEYNIINETRPGVQFFNCLVQLLKECYDNGVVTSLDPSLPLASSYANSYERLTALLAELGSGYVKPTNDNKILNKKPQTPKEEFIRFSQWEVALRQTQPDVSDFPSDLVGSWQVKDEIGGKVIGTSTVVFKPEGEVEVSAPLRGLQWRLDPGPTHLDTCTFQVLSEDGAILQYRGFMDRGARLESRFSKRSIKIRGGVSFQMRDSDAAMVGDDYKRDLLPINTGTGTTRFVMSKVFDLESNQYN